MLLDQGHLVQTRQFGFRQIVGKPSFQLKRYHDWGLDELLILDITKTPSLDHELHMLQWLEQMQPWLSMPLTFGGHITQLAQIENRIRLGAEKVLLNRILYEKPSLIQEGSALFGVQAMVAGIDIETGEGRYWAAHSKDNLCPISHAQKLVDLGAGEIVLNFINRDGMLTGYEVDFSDELARRVPVPVIVCAGCGTSRDIEKLFEQTAVSAAGVGNMLYYTELSYPTLKKALDKPYVREEKLWA